MKNTCYVVMREDFQSRGTIPVGVCFSLEAADTLVEVCNQEWKDKVGNYEDRIGFYITISNVYK